MKIRNIITSAAIAAFLGLAGGSAYAGNNDSHIDEGFTVLAVANHFGTEFVYNGDSDVDTGEILTGGFAQARLPQPTDETLKFN
jgi:hypothetical protein